LIVSGPPKATIYRYEVAHAQSPENALAVAEQYWWSSAWQGPKPDKGVVHIYRRLPDSQDVEETPSFTRLTRAQFSSPDPAPL
jgi:hypothetical protein